MSDEKNRFERIETKIDKIGDKISSIDSTLSAQHESLKEHMRRTALLEVQVNSVQKHVFQVQGVAKFFGVLALVAGIAEGFVILLEFVRSIK